MQCWIAVTPTMDARHGTRAPFSAYTYETDDRSKKNVAAADLLFLRDQKRLIAVAQVEAVTLERRDHIIPKCPVCGIAKIERRKRRDLPYRCFHGHQFATPAEERTSAVVHTATFAHSCVRVAASIEPAELRPFELTNSRHVKLKAADLMGLSSYLVRRDHTIAPVLRDWLRSRTVQLEPGDGESASSQPLALVDEQERPFAAIRMRRGLKAFRDKLISRYGARCMITGCNVLALLEACHVSKYQGPEDNHPANGILLRSDLHTLFDLDLIGLNLDMEVTIHTGLVGTEYEKFAGTRLLLSGGKAIDMRAVRARWEQFTRAL